MEQFRQRHDVATKDKEPGYHYDAVICYPGMEHVLAEADNKVFLHNLGISPGLL